MVLSTEELNRRNNERKRIKRAENGEEVRQKQRDYYKKHADIIKKQVYQQRKRKRERLRKKIDELKNNPCVDCGNIYPPEGMDFDHLPQFKKEFTIGKAMKGDYSWDRVQKEIEKCELVCATCHRIRTRKRIHAKRV